MDRPRCETCRYWDRTIATSGECRRRAPIIHMDESAWPETAPADWCGEHAQEQAPAVGKAETLLDRPIAALGLCTRVNTALRGHQIQTIGQLLNTTEAELRRVRMMGKSGLADIRAQLAKLGLRLAKTLCDTAQEPSP